MVGDKIIVPGVSLNGIDLGGNIDIIMGSLKRNYLVERANGVVSLNNDEVLIGVEDDGFIYSVMCGKSFKGNYKNKLWAGMTVKDILDNSKEQVAFGGCVVVDKIDGIGLPLPVGYDDFERITDFLSLDFVFDYLAIFKKSF
ncbi:hypothetical protein SMX71_004230 [Cronobacter dublinensis]|uniref:hypothetical protein n=1 Tax=Cronobacter dublinensis TaxID=413497 RepID=UPI00192A4DEE|nr:hypothetical protein [Cronobacter dublinensis]EKK4083673.1 hypothetical protein [Cronobacter dublinensis]ELY2739275.1 hypothetical protein [Cronobacter dublinensis]ELY2909627.1 hypothetical protein [Cronobacter dublinensis]ELY3774494.1 hypothetical protein [Cronobacter dublinensis]